MKKYLLALAVASMGALHAQEGSALTQKVEQAFTLNLNEEQKKHCNRFIMELGACYKATAIARKPYFNDLGKRTRGVPTTQFLAYAFENRKRLRNMKWIVNCSVKWPGVRKSLVRALKKEAEDGSLFAALPGFAKYCGADEATLRYLAEEGDWHGFLRHVFNH